MIYQKNLETGTEKQRKIEKSRTTRKKKYLFGVDGGESASHMRKGRGLQAFFSGKILVIYDWEGGEGIVRVHAALRVACSY